MDTTELTVNISDVKKEKSRDKVYDLFRNKGISIFEYSDFWAKFLAEDELECQNTLVLSDFWSLAQHFTKINNKQWSFKVRKHNPYFVTFIRNTRDAKMASLIDDVMTCSYNRITVLDYEPTSKASKESKHLSSELDAILARYYSPKALKEVTANKPNRSFLVEFNDETAGEVTFEELGIQDTVNELLLDSCRISKIGNAVELFTENGEIFDIDADVLRYFISESARKEIDDQISTRVDSVGASLKRVRKDQQLTQQELSRATGIDQSIISKIETGKHLPRIDTLERFAEVFGVSLTELLAS